MNGEVKTIRAIHLAESGYAIPCEWGNCGIDYQKTLPVKDASGYEPHSDGRFTDLAIVSPEILNRINDQIEPYQLYYNLNRLRWHELNEHELLLAKLNRTKPGI